MFISIWTKSFVVFGSCRLRLLRSSKPDGDKSNTTFLYLFNRFFQPTHKIQSGGAAPNIQLQLVPKLLAPLVSLWVPHAFVVSFKLETDENILITKAREALNKYKHKVSFS